MSQPSRKVIDAARMIGNDLLRGADYSLVYEDERLEGFTEEEWREVHDLITRGLRAVFV